MFFGTERIHEKKHQNPLYIHNKTLNKKNKRKCLQGHIIKYSFIA